MLPKIRGYPPLDPTLVFLIFSKAFCLHSCFYESLPFLYIRRREVREKGLGCRRYGYLFGAAQTRFMLRVAEMLCKFCGPPSHSALEAFYYKGPRTLRKFGLPSLCCSALPSPTDREPCCFRRDKKANWIRRGDYEGLSQDRATLTLVQRRLGMQLGVHR